MKLMNIISLQLMILKCNSSDTIEKSTVSSNNDYQYEKDLENLRMGAIDTFTKILKFIYIFKYDSNCCIIMNNNINKPSNYTAYKKALIDLIVLIKANPIQKTESFNLFLGKISNDDSKIIKSEINSIFEFFSNLNLDELTKCDFDNALNLIKKHLFIHIYVLLSEKISDIEYFFQSVAFQSNNLSNIIKECEDSYESIYTFDQIKRLYDAIDEEDNNGDIEKNNFDKVKSTILEIFSLKNAINCLLLFIQYTNLDDSMYVSPNAVLHEFYNNIIAERIRKFIEGSIERVGDMVYGDDKYNFFDNKCTNPLDKYFIRYYDRGVSLDRIGDVLNNHFKEIMYFYLAFKKDFNKNKRNPKNDYGITYFLERNEKGYRLKEKNTYAGKIVYFFNLEEDEIIFKRTVNVSEVKAIPWFEINKKSNRSFLSKIICCFKKKDKEVKEKFDYVEETKSIILTKNNRVLLSFLRLIKYLWTDVHLNDFYDEIYNKNIKDDKLERKKDEYFKKLKTFKFFFDLKLDNCDENIKKSLLFS
ncbi:hypothetical protein A0H76_1944 [Hepatospora eriocheir]|uniref:Uncharacterized protein n=1 Tax=Hepatospora eriocheir TaxID=1081669 RepID=A0A1X0QG68_9MICR|nr:hypothetical protein A0H76_1944 [Hepatospora eriocheir]